MASLRPCVMCGHDLCGGKYTGNIVFTNGSSFVTVDNQRLNNWCYSITDNNKVDGKACSNTFPFICQIATGMVNFVVFHGRVQ